MTNCCQNSNLVLSLFKNILKQFFNYENCQLKNYKSKNQFRIAMVHCCQNSHGPLLPCFYYFCCKEKYFPTFLKRLFKKQKQKMDMDHCCPCGNLSSQSRLQGLFSFQHRWKNVTVLSYIEKAKIYEGEITHLPVLLVQWKFLEVPAYQFRRCNVSFALCNPTCLRYS